MSDIEYAKAKVKATRCLEIQKYVEAQERPVHYVIVQYWGAAGAAACGVLDELPIPALAKRVVQTKNFVFDALDAVRLFIRQAG